MTSARQATGPLEHLCDTFSPSPIKRAILIYGTFENSSIALDSSRLQREEKGIERRESYEKNI